MKRYKVVGSSDPTFMNIEMNIVFDDISMGKECEVFGKKFTITQTGQCIVLSNTDWVLTLLEIPNPDDELQWGHRITDYNELRINHEIDIFPRDKTVHLKETDRLTEEGVTLKAIFEFLQNEWQYITHFIDEPFPFEYDYKLQLFTFQNEWNFQDQRSIDLVKNGSFSRYNAEGRCI